MKRSGSVSAGAAVLWCAMGSLAGICPCHAAQVTVPLGPATAQIGLTVFAVGLWPIPGKFAHFSGRLVVDTDAPRVCRISVDVDAASLHMAGQWRTNLALGPSLLDVSRYPKLGYTGTCTARSASGQLTLHGVTQPLVLISKRTGDEVRATGSLERRDYGIAGLPNLIGRRVDLDLSIELPPTLADQIAPK